MRYIILCLACILSFSACEDAFTTTLEVDPPDHETQMVVHAYFNDRDSVLLVSVGTSVGLLEEVKEDAGLDNATIELYKNGEKVSDFEPTLDPMIIDPWGSPNFYNYFAVPEDGPLGANTDAYELKVTHADFGEAIASTTMPKFSTVSSAKLLGETLGEFGESISNIEITFEDLPNERNFYEFTLVVVDTFPEGGTNMYSIYPETFDPNINGSANYGFLLLEDATFDGKDYVIRLETYYNLDSETSSLKVLWRDLTEDQFLYSQSVRRYKDSQDLGPFAEPVSLYSNVDNGLGIFGMRKEQLFSVEE